MVKEFDKRPHRRFVTSRRCEWIRPMLTSSNTRFLGSTQVYPLIGISIGSAVFARLTLLLKPAKQYASEWF